MKELIGMLRLGGEVPKVKPYGVAKKNERAGQFSRCQCGNCRCCVTL